MNQQFYKNMALWVVLLLMILLLVTVLRQSKTVPAEITYTEFLTKLDAGEIDRVTMEEGHVSGRLADGQDFATFVPPVYDTLVPELQAKGVQITARPKRESSVWQQMLIWWVPFLVLIGLWVFFVRQMQAGGGKAMSFGKSRARLLTENQQRVTFDDVAGVEESKAELEEIIAFLRDPKKFTRLGGRIPKGVLLGRPARVPARRCSRAPSPARPACRSSRSRARTSSRCSSASARRACATSSCRARSTRPASSSSTRSTPSAGTAAPVSAAATTSASRR